MQVLLLYYQSIFFFCQTFHYYVNTRTLWCIGNLYYGMRNFVIRMGPNREMRENLKTSVLKSPESTKVIFLLLEFLRKISVGLFHIYFSSLSTYSSKLVARFPMVWTWYLSTFSEAEIMDYPGIRNGANIVALVNRKPLTIWKTMWTMNLWSCCPKYTSKK